MDWGKIAPSLLYIKRGNNLTERPTTSNRTIDESSKVSMNSYMECCVGVYIETVLQVVKLYTVVNEKKI